MIKRLNLTQHVACRMPSRRQTEKESIIAESLEHKINPSIALHGSYFPGSAVHVSDFQSLLFSLCCTILRKI